MRLSVRCRLVLTLALLASVDVAWAANTKVSSEKPIINFRLPTFTPEGFRKALARGSEARMISENEISIKDLTLSIFTGDQTDRVETLILSPSATLRPRDEAVTGAESIRVINDEFEANGVNWSYSNKERTITIKERVHVKFRAEITNLLQ